MRTGQNCQGECREVLGKLTYLRKSFVGGFSRCNICEYWLDWRFCHLRSGEKANSESRGMYCNCCNFQVRQRPHSREAKETFKIGSLRDKLAKYHGTNVDCAFWGWNDIWLAPEFKEWNIESYLANIILPSLVVQGEDDQYGTSAQVNAIQTGIGPEAKVKIIPNCGHSPQI